MLGERGPAEPGTYMLAVSGVAVPPRAAWGGVSRFRVSAQGGCCRLWLLQAPAAAAAAGAAAAATLAHAAAAGAAGAGDV